MVAAEAIEAAGEGEERGLCLTSPVAMALEPGEWLADPVERQRALYLGADATPWSLAFFNWETGRFVRHLLTARERELIRSHTEGQRRGVAKQASERRRDALYLGVVELAAVVLAALQWGREWRGRLVVAVTDSENALRWIRKGRCVNVYGAHLLRLLGRVGVRHGFTVWAERVRSEDNTLPDCACRTWSAEGGEDPVQARRWAELCSRYDGPTLQEEALARGSQRPGLWFVPSNEEAWNLRLPDETPEEYERARGQPTTPWRAVAGALGCGRAGGRGASEAGARGGGARPQGGAGGRSSGGAWRWDSRRADGTLLDRQAPGYEDELAAGVEAVLGLVHAETTQSKYERAYRHWQTFCRQRGRSHILGAASGTEARREEVQLLLEFVVDQGWLLGRRHTTVEGKLYAIKYCQVIQGLPDPLREAPVLKAALKGLRRAQGDRPSKLPVTVGMLEHIRSYLDLERRDHLVLWAALITAYGFLLRIGEYAADLDGRFNPGLVWSDVVFMREGRVVEPGRRGAEGEPDEVVLHLRQSKNDQFRAGVTRNLYLGPSQDMCPVRVLWRLRAEGGGATPSGPGTDQPVFGMPSGRVIGRSLIAQVLREAAVALGYPAARVSTHSLRYGGATALYQQGYTAEEIRYHGRWRSDCWMGYAHRLAEKSKGLAKDIFRARGRILAMPEAAARA